jgi:hypothetical protein
MVEHLVSDAGVIFASYDPAGEIPTGTISTKEPSQAELKRREKIAAGAW